MIIRCSLSYPLTLSSRAHNITNNNYLLLGKQPYAAYAPPNPLQNIQLRFATHTNGPVATSLGSENLNTGPGDSKGVGEFHSAHVVFHIVPIESHSIFLYLAPVFSFTYVKST